MSPIRLLPVVVGAPLLACCPAPCANEDGLCLVGEDLGEAFLSVRAPADDDVWLVGSEASEGAGPTAAWWDGSAWGTVDTSGHAGAELWWVHPTTDRVTMVGTEGLIVEYDRATEELTTVEGPDPAITFFGVWGAGPEDVWAVGGDVSGGLTPRIWRRTASGWARFIDPTLGEGDAGQIYFKVHGTAADDVWIVGNFGIALHWDGTDLQLVPTDADTDTSTAPVLTVDASGDAPIAVGGVGQALILEYDGAEWRDVTPEFQPPVNGVCGNGDVSIAVGQQGSFHTRGDSGWESTLDVLTFLDYHSCAVSPSGEVWAVGGQITRRPLDQGVIAFAGSRGIPSLR